MAAPQARAVATRQTIIAAGVELFSEVGYGETDMIDVIGRAGTTKGTCYYHFPTKSSLAAAIIEQSSQRVAGAIGPIYEADMPRLHKLLAATFAFIAVTETDATARVGYQLRQAQLQVTRAGVHGFGDTEALFTKSLKGAAVDGDVRADIDHAEAAYTLLCGLVGCRLLADIFDENPFDRLEEVWRTFLRSVAAEETLPGLLLLVRSMSKKYRPQP